MTRELKTGELLAMFDELLARESMNGDEGDEWPTPLVDWVTAYGGGEDPARWLYEPLLPDQGAVAIFAKGGTGKSLLALWIAADLATTRAVDVLYLDYEMTLTTVVDRLEDMGHDDPLTLGHLHYASLPTLAPLDTAEGGRAVVDMARRLGVALVVIDTFGRAVDGEEDKADTVRAWYRWTGQLLKTAGVGFLRIDHAGKKIESGQRGSSAKNDDVDLVWEMTARDHGEYLLRATKRRVDWVAERVVLRQTTTDDGVLGYRFDDGGETYLAGTADVAAVLDELGAPLDLSRRKAMLLLREHGLGRRNNVVTDAVRYRRERSGTTLGYHSDAPLEVGSAPGSGTEAKPQQVPPEYHAVPPAEPDGIGVHTYVVGAPCQAHDDEIRLLFDPLEES